MALLFLWEWGGWGFRLGFRCAGIRNSKCPCGRLWKADASTPDEPSVARPGFVLPSVAAHRCVLAGALRFSNFLPKSHQHLTPGCGRCRAGRPRGGVGRVVPTACMRGSIEWSGVPIACMKKNTIQLSFRLL